MKRKINLVQLDIIQTAARMFLEEGYSKTSPKMICGELDISPGNLTYYFPTKEHLLALMIGMLTDFQWKTVQETVDEGETPLAAMCFELTAMASMCEENDVARDLYITAYTSLRALEIIRKSDTERAKKVFAEFCPDWTDEMYAEAEVLVSGIEYATLMTTSDAPPLEWRIRGAMNQILSVYNVPEERRKKKIERALALDYHKYGEKLFDNFKKYVFELTEKNFDDLVKKRSNSLLDRLEK